MRSFAIPAPPASIRSLLKPEVLDTVGEHLKQKLSSAAGLRKTVIFKNRRDRPYPGYLAAIAAKP